ncbi:hypothetical protein DNTS_032642 [Danionella cerebrum]|uniref:Uncharacterized protein n=1 Tax=Danionella cerebrum TaxID=2873325 RepID=A0A553MPP3_9TELE|nr:hypothetical protein DNTS_032642 [Danionella translucida]
MAFYTERSLEMDGPSRSGGFRQSRRSRSQRDRERRRRRANIVDPRASSPSSASEQEMCRRDSLIRTTGGECRPGFPGARHRPPRRRKRESVSCEEDIIDGFAIASFISLEALELDCSLKPPERSSLIGRGSKRKRDENGGPLSEPEEGPPATYTNSWEQRRKIKSKLKRKGAKCDTESESGDKASDNMEPAFIIRTREVSNNSASAAASNGCPLLPSNSSVPLLSVTPRVSGLERSQERSMEQPYHESISTSSSLPSLAGHSSASVSNLLPEQRNGNGLHHHRHDASSPQHKHKPFLPFHSKSQSIFSVGNSNRNSTSGKPPASSASSSSIRPPTPATSVSLGRGPGGLGSVRPSSRPSPGAAFTPSPSLPPPPPLMQVSPHPGTDQDLICQNLTESNGTSAAGGASVSSSSTGTSSRSTQGQTSIPTMAYQFHHHNHQHQHTHTHQHFLHPTAAPPPLFFPQYQPSVPGIQPVLPPTGPFSSLHGAFQPKGAAPEMASGLGVVPPHLQPKPRLTDPFAPPHKKPGKWCAMHVRVAWMILRHQEKLKLMHPDSQKLDLRNELLPRLPGPGIGGLGGLGSLGGPLNPAHDLSRPGNLFAAAGGVNPSSTPFMPPSTPHSSFLTPAAHLDPYVRSPPFPSLGALGSGAFGGLGSPTIAASVFGHKTEPPPSAVGGLGNPHDPWNRLHVAPASFPSGSSWAKGPEKRDDRVKELERRELTHIKDEKDRDSILYGRPPVRMSPGVPSLKHRSNTPSSHMNGLGSVSGGGIQSDGQSRERERESDKRQHSSSRPPASSSSTAPDRPRSSTSSIHTTSPSNVPLAPSPLDLFHRQPPHTLSTESSRSSQRENNGPASSSSLSSQKADRTTTPVSKPPLGLPSGLLHVKVKEERKEEPEPVPISLPHPSIPPHGFERPSSRHPHLPSTPSSTLSLTPTPGMPLPPPTPHPPHHPLSLLDRTRSIDAYLGGPGGSAGLVLGAAPDRFPPHPLGPSQGHPQATHSFPWDPWRDLAAQQQQQRRDVLTLRSDPHLALRSDPHLSRMQQVQRYLEAERVAVAAAVANSPHHPPVPTSSSSAAVSAGRPEFTLMSHPFDEEQRAQILREDFERARYFGMHPHHLSAPHLPSPSHAAHLEQLHAGLLSHPHLHPAGAAAQASHHPGLYSRLGPLHSHPHVPNGILTKTPSLVGALSVGAPPPLIPSVNRSSTPPRVPRLGPGDLALFNTHKDESRYFGFEEKDIRQLQKQSKARSDWARADCNSREISLRNLVSRRSFLHFAASKVSSPQPLHSAIPDPVSVGPFFNLILRTCQYLTGCSGALDLSILEVEITEDTGSVCSGVGSEAGQPGEEVVQQHTCPAVAVQGGISSAAQNVAGPPQHALQPVAAATPSPSLAETSTGSHQSGGSKTAGKVQTIVCFQQSSTIKDSEKVPPVQRGLVPATAEESQKLTKTFLDQTPSNRLLENRAESIAQEQGLLYRCNSEQTSISYREAVMAEGFSTGHCQDWSQQAGEAGGIFTSTETTKGLLPPGTIQMENEISGKHTPGESPSVSKPQFIEQLPKAPLSQTNQTAPSSEFGIQQKQGSTYLSKEVYKPESAETLADVGQNTLRTFKESDRTKQDIIGKPFCSGYSSKQEEKHSITSCGNSTPKDSVKSTCHPTENCSPTQKALQSSNALLKTSGFPSPPENLLCAQELSSPDVHKAIEMVSLGQETVVRVGQEKVAVDEDLCPSLAAKEVFCNISLEPKLSEHGTCVDALIVPNMSCDPSATILKQNKSANQTDVSTFTSANHLEDQNVILDHEVNCVTPESIDFNLPSRSECLAQQQPIPTDHKLSQIQMSPNDTPAIGNVKQRPAISSGTSSLTDVAVLMQPQMENTWLVVSEIVRETEHPGLEVIEEPGVQPPESQAAVYECAVPCFNSAAIHSDVKLLVTDKEEEPIETITQAQSNEGTQPSSETSPVLIKEGSVLVQKSVDAVLDDHPRTLKGLISTTTDVAIDQKKSVVLKNTPGVSFISIITIDPKQPSAQTSIQQNSSVQDVSQNDGTNKECLSETDTAALLCTTDTTLSSDHTVSKTPSQTFETVSSANIISRNSFEKDNFPKSNSPRKNVQTDTSLSTSVHQNSQKNLSSAQGILGSVSSDVLLDTWPSAGKPDLYAASFESELDLEQDQLQESLLSKDSEDTIQEPHEVSVEESSNEDVEVQNEDPNTESSSGLSKVRQWIADKVSAASTFPTSHVQCQTSPVSSGDWTHSHTGRTSPVQSPRGKNIASTSSQAEKSTTQKSTPKHSDLAELAKHEAEIEHRSLALKREGFWSIKRLSRLNEPVRPKVHWDYLCEEMQWLSADFAQERRWKRGVARKVVRMVMRHHEELRQKEERAKREEQAKLRRVASSIAKEVRSFWGSVEKVVQYKQQSRLEEKRKKALDLQLDFIVGQTERYSDLLSQSLHATPVPSSDTAAASKQSQQITVDEEDRDFEPPCEEEDDEETIEVEEQQEGNDVETQKREIELLQEESILPLDQLLSTLTLPQDVESDEEESDESSSNVEEDDKEFSANEEDAEDEEDTIAAQEVIEGEDDHTEELDDLAKEGDMSMEELLEKYKGAYASDFEEASAESSDESEGTEEEAEEETEGEDSVEDSASSSDSHAEDTEDEKDDENVQGSDAEDDDRGEGMEFLLRETDQSPSVTSPRPKKEISHITATAESLQPKGYTLATTKVKTPIPFLLHGTLREYQHIGLDWLVTMNEKKLNGILADEMGLGKTIQTIALLAHLACVKGNWGPHLIIVPTSVMLNWEMELKRWCPGFKILTYYGSQKERKLKRQGWTKPNAFHVCITSYKLVLQDHQAFRRKSWRYLILDEAQNIKNFKSQRWQSLLNFNSQRRLLLTGTPLQNSLMELWSLMHFLMPHVFQSHREFKEWFSNPLTGMIEGSQEYNEGLVKRLHKVLRPFLLRRIKADVEKQMPKKYEHVVRCRLSKRQRFLYDDFMAQASTRETLASGHFMSVINILMQLRKVCNHPNLFDPRPIQSPFITKDIVFSTASLVQCALETSPFERCDLSIFDLVGLERRVSRYQADVYLPQRKVTRQLIEEIMESPDPPPRPKPVRMKDAATPPEDRWTSSHKQSSGFMSYNHCIVPGITPAPAVRTLSTQPVAIRSPTLSTLPTPSQPPSNSLTQRVLLSPDMQARLSTGEVVSIAQLASLAGTPVSSSQGNQPVTFQLQGNMLTLAETPMHQVPLPQARPLQGNVMHLVSSSGHHHLISQPAQVTLLQTVSQSVSSSTAGTIPSCSGVAVPFTAAQVQTTKPLITAVTTSKSQPATQACLGTTVSVPKASVAPSNVLPSPAVRPLAAQPVAIRSPPPTTTTPSNNLTQRVLLSPDLQARLPFSTSMASGPGIFCKMVVCPAPSKEGAISNLAVAHSPRPAPPQSVTLHPHGTPSPVPRAPTASQPPHRTPVYAAPPRNTASSLTPPTRHVLRVVQRPPTPAPVAKTNSQAVSDDGNKAATLRTATSKPASSSQSTGSKSQRPRTQLPPPPRSPFYTSWLADTQKAQRDDQISQIMRVNELRCSAKPVYGSEVLGFLTFLPGPCPSPAHSVANHWSYSGYSSCLTAQSQENSDILKKSKVLKDAIHNSAERLQLLSEVIDRFVFIIPPVEAKPITMHSCHPPPHLKRQQSLFSSVLSSHLSPLTNTLHRIQCNMRTYFPDLRLIQYDSGKLQTLHLLLRQLKVGGHRVLIFTQMTRMLDVLEQFLNYHGHIYLRLDGSTRVEQRQALMERFNADRRIFCFILSTRSGGVGVNLTGADTVVFYDSDWNPTMDAQAQDRCHRIGQTRDVHIYRLISERTVEENILKKANQKRMLGDMAIEGGNFTTAFFKQQTIRELFDVTEGEKKEAELSLSQADEDDSIKKQQTTILEQALCRAEDEEDIVAASQAKAEQVADLAEFNENIPLDDGDSRDQEEEELSKAEQEIAALVEQLTPIERYAMNFLEASLEDISKEELKQAEEQVEAARKGLDQAKEEGLKLHQSSDSDDEDSVHPNTEEPTPKGRLRKHKEKGAPSTRVSGRLRGTPADDVSLSHASPDRGRRGTGLSSEHRTSQSPGSPQKMPLNREVPEKLRSGLRGRGTTKESASLVTSVNQSIQTNQLIDLANQSPPMQGPGPKITSVPSTNKQLISPSSSVPSTSASTSAVDRKSTNLSTLYKENSEEQRVEIENLRCKDRRASASSDSMCSPEHHSDQDGQHSLSPSLASPNYRSPRKRQSAEWEILKGLPEDSPSAKVLRKLPGRLVTVVEEKEPKRRRRGMSGCGATLEGSSEEPEKTELVQDCHSPNKPSLTAKDSPPKSVALSPASSPPPPLREQEYPSPHLPYRASNPCSPDMPVLRNLPVRRRLETESRMAAQLGEQFFGKGRGTDRKSSLSSLKLETNTDKDSLPQSDSSLVMKRKRGRPPKITPPKTQDPSEGKKLEKTSPGQSPPLSPKRKRGRPRKDSISNTTSPPSSPSCSSHERNLPRSNDVPPVTNNSPVTLNPTSLLNTAEQTSSTKPNSEMIQTTLFVSPSSQEVVLDSHVDNSNPSTDSDGKTALVSQILKASDDACSITTKDLGPVLSETSEITEPVSMPAIEAEPNLVEDGLKKDNLHKTNSAVDSDEPMDNVKVSLQPCSSLHMSSGTDPELTSLADTPESSVGQTSKTVECELKQSPRHSNQSCVPPSTPQTTSTEDISDSHSQEMVSSQSAPDEATDSFASITDSDSQLPIVAVKLLTENHEARHSPKETETEKVVVSEEAEAFIAEEMEIECDDGMEMDSVLSQSKRRKLDGFPKEQMPNLSVGTLSNADTEIHEAPKSDGQDNPSEEEEVKEVKEKTSVRTRCISRQSSQESVRSSSPSSVSSSGTRLFKSKKVSENKRAVKRKQEDIKCEKDKNKEKVKDHSNSSSSSDSDDSSSLKKCLTRSAQKILEKGGVIAKNDESSIRQKRRVDKKRKTTSTTDGDSSGETSSRVTRRSAGPTTHTLHSPEPEVLGKRCSALNAAAKLLAMRVRGPDTPSLSPKNKTTLQPSKPPPSEENGKHKGKLGQDSPMASNSKGDSVKQVLTQSVESPQSSSSRSTRQRPCSLVPPLEMERFKKEEKKRQSDSKGDGNDEIRETRSSRGHSACSSISSSRSRSSSNSSQRTHSLSSQSTEPIRTRSRATSSGSETEKAKSGQRKSSRGRESRKDKKSHKLDKPELSAGSSEGTPDRVLRSVAALAAAQARPPANNTRSSSTQSRHSKT